MFQDVAGEYGEKRDDVMNYLIITLAVFGVIACGLTGTLWYLRAVKKMIVKDLQYGLVIDNLKHVAIVVGVLSGSISGSSKLPLKYFPPGSSKLPQMRVPCVIITSMG